MNQTQPANFILCGLLYHPESDLPLFSLFTITYIMAVIGNSTVILMVLLSPTLHTPMYFFLTNLSILDICCISTTVPKMLHNFVTASFTISFYGCAAQLYIFTWVEITELLLLTYMAFDRYIAICKPLHYNLIITPKVCLQMSISLWLSGKFCAVVHTSLTFSLPFCRNVEINHFFCEFPPLVKLACTDTTLNEMFALITDIIMCVFCLSFIVVSYFFIILSIFRIKSEEGRRKAISTCTSHITVVFIFYGTLFVAYMKPHSDFFPDQNKILAIVYVIYIPLLNPLIYTLRNRDMAHALTTLINKIKAR
ncbi:olfactory receptor 2G3-like [Hyperolius riggenbachi]|uniref:olfactory receptor 2G3-like n=1 Tax=Hyperolius riggenbachi TaxID=752182 RepID=UPI0035A34D1D